MLRSMVRLETVHGEEVRRGDLRVTPMARTLVIRAPRPITVGLSWSWPAAVTVQQGDEAPKVVPVVDPTRKVLLALSAAMALTGLVALALGMRGRCCR
jgi:hypothetical protein